MIKEDNRLITGSKAVLTLKVMLCEEMFEKKAWPGVLSWPELKPGRFFYLNFKPGVSN